VTSNAPVDSLSEPSIPLPVVTQLITTFGKAVRAHQLYLPNNPMYARAIETVREAFQSFWQETEALEFKVTESQFLFEGHSILDEPGRSGDSLPWIFYKDGIRELKLLPGFERDDLLVLLDILQKSRKASPDDDDLLTLMWEQEFATLQYKYMDFAGESGPTSIEGIRSEEVPERIDAPRTVEASAGGLTSSTTSSTVRMEDFDATLYFLDESEIEYMHTEIKKDFSSDLRPHVIASLLDTFEQEEDPTVRDEVIGILEYVLLVLLASTQYKTAAYLLRETALSAGRARGLLLNHQQRLAELTDRVSDSNALGQLLQALEDTPLRPPQHELNELFLQLKPASLETVLTWIPRTTNNELQQLLENAASRLAASHTGELVRLIGSEDDNVALEAIRRAGALKTTAAVTALGQMIATADAGMRLAAVNALAEIASPGAMQVLERAVEDEDRDIRVAAVRVLGSRTYKPSLPRIENFIKGKNIRDTNLSEKMAFFEAYGTLCGDSGISFLDGLLNTRALMGKKEDPELRACAALALGKIGGPKAIDVLKKAAGEKDVMVRNAVTRAIRSSAV
jgi:hypothetical protein